MNEEIKELLDYLKIENGHCSSELSYEETRLLLDYITNLQQENERLKELDENYPIEEELAEAYRREEDYKSRIEKADWYLNESLECLYHGANFTFDELIHNTSDILNGKSDE